MRQHNTTQCLIEFVSRKVLLLRRVKDVELISEIRLSIVKVKVANQKAAKLKSGLAMLELSPNKAIAKAGLHPI